MAYKVITQKEILDAHNERIRRDERIRADYVARGFKAPSDIMGREVKAYVDQTTPPV